MAAAIVTVSALLLIVAGAAKVISPDPASDALGVVGLPSHPTLVRIGSGLEVGVGLFALLVAGPIGPVLLALSYGAFAIFIVMLRREPDAASCGCFGAEGEVPSVRHVVVDSALAIGCLIAAITAAPSTMGLLRGDLPLGIAFLIICAMGAWLAGLVLGATPLGSES
jgi:hypothetical protein